jgi:hypothetical protein
VGYVAGIVLTIPAFLVWRMPRRWWEALDRPYGDRVKAMLQSIPGFTVGAWLLFGVFFPIDAGLGGNRPGGGMSLAEAVAIIACGLPWLTTLIGGWPLWLVPPGARNVDDARFFTSHWAGIFGFCMAASGVLFALHAWWPAVWTSLAAAVIFALIQVGLVSPRSHPGQ